ncbi:MAG: flagellar basal body L-ring protein FlgH [Pseudomonadota bacterium]
MNALRLIGGLGLAAALGACGTTPSSIVEHPTTARPEAQPVHAPGNGTIYQASAYRPLFEDRRARRVGDILTIQISERTQAGKQASSNASKESKVDSSIGAVAGVPLKMFQGAGVNAEGSVAYDDKSALNASNIFTGSVTATVIEVLPNGNLRVAGEKQVGLDKGTEYIRLSGIVQPETIRPGNVVPSSQVADARIEYRTSAKLDTAEMMSWLARFFLSFIPL